MPPVPAYYQKPASLEECTRTTAERVLSQFGLDESAYEWQGMHEHE